MTRTVATSSPPGLVSLVGAGPGDPGLLTLRGLECLRRADTVVYDHLVNPRLLEHAPVGSERLYVGKEAGRHELDQPGINRVLAERALAGRRVIRLKGGDPLVFGRGGEEALHLRECGVPFEIVPGVTAAVAAAAYAGIPVTHRGLTTSFALLTGHEDPSKEASTIPWRALADGIGTLAFYMGVRNLGRIVERLREHGLPADTPVAVIERGTEPSQRTAVGTLATIVAETARLGIAPPAVTIVGRVVGLRERLNWFESRPLFGRRVLVTRSRTQASALTDRLEALGAAPVVLPTLRIEDPRAWGPLDRALRRLDEFDWVVLSSANGVERFLGRLRATGRDARALARTRIAAIGPGTAEALRAACLEPDLIPREAVAEALAAELGVEAAAGKRFLLPQGDRARDVLARELERHGGKVLRVEAYRSVLERQDRSAARELLAGPLDAATFASSQTARNLVEIVGRAEARRFARRVPVVTIGPITSDTCRELGMPVAAEAKAHTIAGLVEAVEEVVGRKR
ncbi:MAG: uroporphyrinogen-III C-methyltransferase [Planctomycetes bacterium]|nr:uroporphyrinogen-III C-methyltransferase [Planctomycetota bacterium]